MEQINPDSGAPDNSDPQQAKTDVLTQLQETEGLPVQVFPLPQPEQNKKKLVMLLVAILLVGGIAGAGWFFVVKDGVLHTSRKQGDTTAAYKDVFLSPRFTSVREPVQFENAGWYVIDGGVVRIHDQDKTRFFTHREGVPYGSLNNLVVHNKRLWLASDSGVAVFKKDGSGFEKMSINEQKVSNGNLLYDQEGKKLFYSTFENFYQLNESNNKWEAMSGGPNRANTLIANKDFIVIESFSEGEPVWIFNRQTGKWNKQSPSVNELTTSTFRLNDEIFAIGQTKGYIECEDAGKVTATSAFLLDKNGAWQPLTSFNNDKLRPEFHMYWNSPKAGATVASRPCTDSKASLYELTYNGTTIVLKDMGEIPDDNATQQAMQQDTLVNKIAAATKLYPYVDVQTIDSQGNVIFVAPKKAGGFKMNQDESVYVAKGADVQNAQQIDVPSLSYGSVVRPILCGDDGKRTLSYIFVGEEDTGDGEGGPLGYWFSTAVYKVTDNKVVGEPVDLKNDVATPSFSCGKDKITWLSRSAILQLDTSTNAIAQIGPTLSADLSVHAGDPYALVNGDLWLLLPSEDTDNSYTLYYVESAKQSVREVTTISKNVSLKAGTPSLAWLGIQNGADADVSITAYDKQGKPSGAKQVYLPHFVTPVSDTAAYILSSKTKDLRATDGKFIVGSLNSSGAFASIDTAHTPFQQMAERGSSHLGSSHTGVFDPGRKLIWVTDQEFGTYTIPVR